MIIAIYVRTSTEKQEGKNQEIELREYCVRNKYDIHNVYKDVMSGKEDSRPSFDTMFRDAHQKKFDLVLFWDMSRFSRSGLAFTIQKLKELENLGIAWHSYSEPYVNTDNEMMRDIVIAVISSIAKAEREKISERTKLGLKRALIEGKKLGRPKGKKDKKKRIRKYFKKL